MNVAIIADLHCGHIFGLTPPEYQVNPGSEVQKVQALMWDFYVKSLKDRKKIDILIVNGDAIDGKGEKSGSTEVLTADRDVQVDMAVECITQAKADKVIIIHGTGYHTGNDEDWEGVLAKRVNAIVCGGHEQIRIGGVLFDLKHHLGGTSIPHGIYTSPAREQLWSEIWAERTGQEAPDVVIRSHRHRFAYCGDGYKLNIVTPGWQWHTKYGGRRCVGLIDIGLIWFECKDGGYSWGHELLNIKQLVHAPKVL
jgi:predicted phosphodiesterase